MPAFNQKPYKLTLLLLTARSNPEPICVLTNYISVSLTQTEQLQKQCTATVTQTTRCSTKANMLLNTQTFSYNWVLDLLCTHCLHKTLRKVFSGDTLCPKLRTKRWKGMKSLQTGLGLDRNRIGEPGDWEHVARSQCHLKQNSCTRHAQACCS